MSRQRTIDALELPQLSLPADAFSHQASEFVTEESNGYLTI
jgi:hypothetical protein